MKTCPTCQRTHPDEIAFCPHDGTRLQADAALPAGHVLDGRYEIESLIAETRTGRLYRARDLRLNRRVLLQTFSPELRDEIARWPERYRGELRAASGFRHPYVAEIYDVRSDYIVMEYAAGESLDKELRRRGSFAPGEVIGLLALTARALDAARASGLTFDFLTPADIRFACAEDNQLSVKLLPLIFNRPFAVRAHEDILSVGESDAEADAAPYVAPEFRDADAVPPPGARRDVYSLGVIAYELLSGRKPSDGLTSREMEEALREGQPARLWEVARRTPLGVALVLARALLKEGAAGYATAGEFIFELSDALGVEWGGTTDPSAWASAESPRRAGSVSQQAAAPPPLAKKSPGRLEGKPESRDDIYPAAAASTSVDDIYPAAASASVADKPLYADENVQFTVYQPEAVAPARWHTLLAFAHLSKRRPDAPPDEPEPLAEVRRIAERVLAEEAADYDAVKQNSLHAVPQKGEITFVPEIEGCEFNPPSQSFLWQKSVHKVEFELRASASLDGRVARGRLTVFLGTLILADVPLAIRVDGSAVGHAAAEAPPVLAAAVPYRKIFPSYSHKDRAVVEQIEHHVRALGDKYLRDVSELRAGQDWQRWMRDAIREADVFQLFWSHNSMRSVYVRQEWEYALSLGRPNFVRPTYWEVPLPESPAENLPPAELRQLHFQHLRANTITYHPTMAATTSDADVASATEEAAAVSSRDDAYYADHSHTGSLVFERAEPIVDGRPGGLEIMCMNCHAHNRPEMAYCLNCGASLSTPARQYPQAGAAQSTPQIEPGHTAASPAATTAQEAPDAPDVYWSKRPREAAQTLPATSPASPTQSYSPPPQAYSPPPAPYLPQTSPGAPRGRSLFWFALLFFLALALGVYLLVRLL